MKVPFKKYVIYNEKYVDLSEEEAERKVKEDGWEWEDQVNKYVKKSSIKAGSVILTV
ncbi:hypothetical protein MUN88_02825 [Gracilibacillus caseinilyticus]|uniref:Uncharacterized protein n=1 Tax=Gracilibacillus caseinilyticus TaxID=2932256 RepID=A0ABY4EXE9_9BACI|nr:hypothetical protein [Gracilibacillus caseinilyticus]UOQ49090.1 hypothetical protein MUN88_02825 [Gracilibacillus caseinilyticus]